MQQPIEASRSAQDSARHGDRALLLVARSAFAAAPHRQMERIAARAAKLPGVSRAGFCFVEQGTPSLLERLIELRREGLAEITLVPLMLPIEPGFRNWLTRCLRRWQTELDGPWPRLSIATAPADSPVLDLLLGSLIGDGNIEPIPTPERPLPPEGSLVPAQKRRVLLCAGRACNEAGADAIWGHLRNVQERRKLRVTGEGVMTAKSTCLGPCSLAPVMQVFPEGTYYGGVTEAAIDAIVEQHLLSGSIVEAFSYHPTGRKQRLRDARPRTAMPHPEEDEFHA
ncbi:MAG: NAD(P)H-dependent oxidoreductase subunit E [Mesorhizobium sp.]|nr:NAD(P)H-dependent oxidoreductase subunit E [Mesorhizobium sp.]